MLTANKLKNIGIEYFEKIGYPRKAVENCLDLTKDVIARVINEDSGDFNDSEILNSSIEKSMKILDFLSDNYFSISDIRENFEFLYRNPDKLEKLNCFNLLDYIDVYDFEYDDEFNAVILNGVLKENIDTKDINFFYSLPITQQEHEELKNMIRNNRTTRQDVIKTFNLELENVEL